MKRGAVTKKESEFIGLWVPKPLVVLIERGVQKQDSDRSKFVRAAIREKVQRELAGAR